MLENQTELAVYVSTRIVHIVDAKMFASQLTSRDMCPPPTMLLCNRDLSRRVQVIVRFTTLFIIPVYCTEGIEINNTFILFGIFLV